MPLVMFFMNLLHRLLIEQDYSISTLKSDLVPLQCKGVLRKFEIFCKNCESKCVSAFLFVTKSKHISRIKRSL